VKKSFLDKLLNRIDRVGQGDLHGNFQVKFKASACPSSSRFSPFSILRQN
jgi:hypothetical protein